MLAAASEKFGTRAALMVTLTADDVDAASVAVAAKPAVTWSEPTGRVVVENVA